jgi:hypothetical protein
VHPHAILEHTFTQSHINKNTQAHTHYKLQPHSPHFNHTSEHTYTALTTAPTTALRPHSQPHPQPHLDRTHNRTHTTITHTYNTRVLTQLCTVTQLYTKLIPTAMQAILFHTCKSINRHHKRTDVSILNALTHKDITTLDALTSHAHCCCSSSSAPPLLLLLKRRLHSVCVYLCLFACVCGAHPLQRRPSSFC